VARFPDEDMPIDGSLSKLL